MKEFFLNKSEALAPKIVGITGHATSEYHEKGLESGMDKVISKPLYFESLNEIIQEYGLIE